MNLDKFHTGAISKSADELAVRTRENNDHCLGLFAMSNDNLTLFKIGLSYMKSVNNHCYIILRRVYAKRLNSVSRA